MILFPKTAWNTVNESTYKKHFLAHPRSSDLLTNKDKVKWEQQKASCFGGKKVLFHGCPKLWGSPRNLNFPGPGPQAGKEKWKISKCFSGFPHSMGALPGLRVCLGNLKRRFYRRPPSASGRRIMGGYLCLRSFPDQKPCDLTCVFLMLSIKEITKPTLYLVKSGKKKKKNWTELIINVALAIFLRCLAGLGVSSYINEWVKCFGKPA